MICAESNHQRISFSSDLGQSEITPVEPSTPVRRDTSLLDSSNSDFEFHISRNLDQESSPADEIFANGMILPIPFQVTAAATVPKRLYKYELPPIISARSHAPCPPPPPLPENPRKFGEKEMMGGNGSGENWDSEAEKSAKSFWSFKRSASLNCDIKRSLICSFPRLTRSNSTGSVTNSKRAMLRDVNKHSSQRHGISGQGANPSSPQVPSSPSSLCCSAYQFRPHKLAGKKGGNGGGGSFRVSPVIGVPSPFGLGSILRHSRDQKKKKKN
ncbi:PREDICTED: uncharacterized protein LOC104820385 isoform X2 [Tarenaya hassleriana]|nr:PREDICTED: uncharacterized protein LOC104820385 isoform X2 [Tarenaya hassleriana]